MNVPGEDLPKYFIILKRLIRTLIKMLQLSGQNSSVDAAMELVKAGARVTVLYRGNEYSSSIKPWILPEFLSLVKHGKSEWNSGRSSKKLRKTS
ncbi:NAD(P)-binding domain-containing protein [Bacillus licheniformis]|nr:NAD(P)-binding domain-containing protein [Bacillus licheniformis]